MARVGVEDFKEIEMHAMSPRSSRISMRGTNIKFIRAVEHYQGRIQDDGQLKKESVSANPSLEAWLSQYISYEKLIDKAEVSKRVLGAKGPPATTLTLQAKIAAQMELAGELYDIQDMLRTELSTAEQSIKRLTGAQELVVDRMLQKSEKPLPQTIDKKQPTMSKVQLSLWHLKSASRKLVDKWAVDTDTASEVEAMGDDTVFNVFLSRKLREWLHELGTRYPHMKEMVRRGHSKEIGKPPSPKDTTTAEQPINSDSAASITDLTAPKDQLAITKESESETESYTPLTTLPQTSQDEVRRSPIHDSDSSSAAEFNPQEASRLQGRDTQRSNSEIRDRDRRRTNVAKGDSTTSNVQHRKLKSDEADGLVDSPW